MTVYVLVYTGPDATEGPPDTTSAYASKALAESLCRRRGKAGESNDVRRVTAAKDVLRLLGLVVVGKRKRKRKKS